MEGSITIPIALIALLIREWFAYKKTKKLEGMAVEKEACLLRHDNIQKEIDNIKKNIQDDIHDIKQNHLGHIEPDVNQIKTDIAVIKTILKIKDDNGGSVL
jgi:ribosomal protein L29